MKKLITSALILLFSLIIYSQPSSVSIEQFRKLEEKLNGLITENQQLNDRIKSLEDGQTNLSNKVDRESRSNRSKNSSTKQEVESQIASQQSSVNAQISSFDTKITQMEADLIYSVDRRVNVTEARLDTLISQMQSDVLSSIKDSKFKVERTVDKYERKLRSALSQLNNSLPVGSIVPYHLNPSNLPDNWVLCHGQEINDSESIYNGYKVPYLKGYFIRGKKDSEDNGDKGGSDYIQSHSHSIPSHKHEVGSHTHPFTTNENRGGFKYATINYVYDISYSLKGAKGYIKAHKGSQQIAYFDDYEHNNYHKHWGTTKDASTGYTQNEGGGMTGSVEKQSNVPKYKAYNYIIKIK